ncbi:MAG TPA: DNA repair protein RecO [Spirochaetota bacterium]|nr:DNA repair protein RecO [Spirochaetota bacterium]
MSRQQTRGIVLSRSLSGEADYICSIFTKDRGREKFIFKGIRKSRKRPRSASEPGTILDIIYYTGKSGPLNTVSEFDIASSCGAIRGSSNSIFSLCYMLELIDATTGFGDINERIYSLLSAGIDSLGKTKHPLHFLIFFTARYMDMQGIMPETESCSWCGRGEDAELFLDPVSLRMSCSGCSGGGKAVNSTASRYLRHCLRDKFSRIEPNNYDRELISPLFFSLRAYIENYFSVKLKSADMLVKT